MKWQVSRIGKLFFRFIAHCVGSGLGVAALIVRGRQPPSGLVRVRFAPMSERGAALYGAMVTLTPGSSVVDIDTANREMLLHLIDIASAEAMIASVRRDFESDIAQLFPEDSQ